MGAIRCKVLGLMHQLEGPRLKLEWAAKHLAVLDAEVAKFRAAHPYPIDHSVDPVTGRSRLTVQQRSEANPEIGLIAGDVVHNLRAALDHLYWQLVLVCGGTPNKSTFFPIWEQQPDKKRLENFRKVVKTGPREIIEAMQPYQTGKSDSNRLGVLHRLDVIDKHHRMMVADQGMLVQPRFGGEEESGFKEAGDEAVFFPVTFKSVSGDVVELNAKAERVLTIDYETASGERGTVYLGEDGELHAILKRVKEAFAELEPFFLHE